MSTFSKKEAFLSGWRNFKERPFFLIGLFILTTIISAISGFVAEEVGTGGVGFVLSLLDFAIQVIIGMGITLIMLRVHDGVDTNYGDLLEPLHLFWKYLAMTILVLVVILMGLLLLIIPGIIAGIALSFASYLVIDRNLGPVEAMKESLRITNGHKWNLLLFGLSVLFFNILGALFFGVGLLITIPISALATVYVYRWLLESPVDDGANVSPVTKALTTLFLVLLAMGVAFTAMKLSGSSIFDSPEARDAQRRADLTDIKLSAALYFDIHNVFPASLEVLVPDYLEALPLDPATNELYAYVAYSDGIDYELCATLEDTEFSGEQYCEFGIEPEAHVHE